MSNHSLIHKFNIIKLQIRKNIKNQDYNTIIYAIVDTGVKSLIISTQITDEAELKVDITHIESWHLLNPSKSRISMGMLDPQRRL